MSLNNDIHLVYIDWIEITLTMVVDIHVNLNENSHFNANHDCTLKKASIAVYIFRYKVTYHSRLVYLTYWSNAVLFAVMLLASFTHTMAFRVFFKLHARQCGCIQLHHAQDVFNNICPCCFKQLVQTTSSACRLVDVRTYWIISFIWKYILRTVSSRDSWRLSGSCFFKLLY